MFKKLMPVLLVFALGSSVLAQVVLKPAKHAFGEVKSGTFKTFKVKVINSGPQTLVLSEAKLDNPDISVEFPEQILRPKGSIDMNILFQAAPVEKGFKTYSVVLNTEPIGNTQTASIPQGGITFQMSANLITESYMNPPIMKMSSPSAGQTLETTGEFFVDPKPHPHWKPGKITITPDGFSAQIAVSPTSGLYKISVKSKGPLPQGHISGKVTISGMNPKDQDFNYPFEIMISSVWNVSPGNLTLGHLTWNELKNWKPKTLLQLVNRKPFEIKGILDCPEWIKFDLNKVSPGTFRIQWRVDEGLLKKEKDPVLPIGIRVITDQKTEGSFTIPLKTLWSAPASVGTVVPISSPVIIPLPGIKSTPLSGGKLTPVPSAKRIQ